MVYKLNVFIRGMVKIFSIAERWKFPFHEATAELNGKCYLSPNENIFTIARIKTFTIIFI